MLAVKVLERKGVIQLFGLALILAPFANMTMSLWVRYPLIGDWNFPLFWQIFSTTTSVPAKFLYVLSVIIGAVMLRGSASAWKFVLILLGCYIAIQIPHLRSDIKANKLMGLIFLVNVFVFYFIADQLVWKIKAAVRRPASAKPSKIEPSKRELPTREVPKIKVPEIKVPEKEGPALVAKERPRSTRPVVRARKKVWIHLENFGPWAELKSVSKEGIQVRCLRAPPPGIEFKEIEISLKNGLILPTRFAMRDHQDFYFAFGKLNSTEIKSLNTWLKEQVA